MFKPGDKIKRTGVSWGDVIKGQVYEFVAYYGGGNLKINGSERLYATHYWELVAAPAEQPQEDDVPAHTLFQKGDKIRRIAGGDDGKMKKGSIYTFVEYTLGGQGLRVEESGSAWDSDKFVLVTKAADVVAAPPVQDEPAIPAGLSVGVRFKFKKEDFFWTVVDEQLDHYKLTASNGMHTDLVWAKTSAKFAQDHGHIIMLPNDIPTEFAPGVWVRINKIVYTSGLEELKKAKWEGAVIKLRKKYEGPRWHPEARPDLDMSIHNWVDVRDCIIVAAPVGAALAYVPPPRKVKVYNAERKSHV